MIVWVVSKHGHEHGDPVAVFSTEEKAKAWIQEEEAFARNFLELPGNAMPHLGPDEFLDVTEFELDIPLYHTFRRDQGLPT
jgi:hypothetical protein